MKILRDAGFCRLDFHSARCDNNSDVLEISIAEPL